METSQQPLTTESFSYSWLTNKRPSFDFGSDDDDDDDEEEAYFIVKSRRFLEEYDHNFNFDVPMSNSSGNALVHADEIFVNGHIMPLNFDATTSTAPTTPIPPSFSSKTVYFTTPNGRKCCRFWGKWKRSSKRVLYKCFRFLMPRKSIRVDDIDRKVWEVKSLSHISSGDQSSPPPRRNMTCCSSTSGDWSKQLSIKKANSWSDSPRESPVVRVLPYSRSSKDVFYDRESSVYEAVLHCKKSFEN